MYSLRSVEEELAALPTGDRESDYERGLMGKSGTTLSPWQKQLQIEEEAYFEGRKTRGATPDINTFKENTYERPKIPFGPYFIHLINVNYGHHTDKGAYYLYKNLQKIPKGYTYYGDIEKDDVPNRTKELGLEVKIISEQAYDHDGNIQEGYVVTAVSKDLLKQKRGY